MFLHVLDIVIGHFKHLVFMSCVNKYSCVCIGINNYVYDIFIKWVIIPGYYRFFLKMIAVERIRYK